MTAAQLPLPFPDAPDYGVVDFLQSPSNADALFWLRDTPCWPDGRLVIWGQAGCGKTHLVTIWAAVQRGAIRTGSELAGLPALPDGGLAIDDANLITDERALLHLLNIAKETHVPVLMAAREPPARWRLSLADLASRVRGTTAVRIMPPEDELLRALLSRLLSTRQIAVAEGVQEWLFRRLPRTPAAIRAAAAALDLAAMADGTAVTRSVAARVLAELGEAAEPQP